jgi:nitroreductase
MAFAGCVRFTAVEERWTSMELLDGIKTRRSYRSYKSIPIPSELIDSVLEAAGRSPSFTNTQPWEIAVVSGAKKDDLSRVLCGLVDSKTPANPDIPMPTLWPSELERRARDHGARRFRALGIERENEQQRNGLRMMNFEFYGAPSVVFIFIDSSLTSWSIFDAGLFAQSFCLAAHAVGLGTCLQAALASYPDAVRQFLGLPKTRQLVIGISIGYPDLTARINTYQSTRVDLNEFVSRRE